VSQKITVPDIGDFENVEVVEILVEAGQRIEKEDSLISVESDKATLEVPSPFSGTLVELHVQLGDRVSQGSLIATIDAEAAPPVEAPPARSSAEPVPERPRAAEAPVERAPVVAAEEPPASDAVALPSPSAIARPQSAAHASPSVRRFARELGVDLDRVAGTGRKGRILREDVQSHVKRSLAESTGAATTEGLSIEPLPEIDFSRFGEVEIEDLHRIRQISAKRLHASWVTIPHVTQFDDADITELEAFRKARRAEAESGGVKLTLLPFLMKAVVSALRAYPRFAASLDPGGEKLILKRYFHIGVAVDTPNGLVVPVVREVDQKGLFDLAAELTDLSERARSRKLKPEEMQGGCFTISSLGGIGGTKFTPIVNPPEVAILGASRMEWRPVYRDGEFVPRLILPLSLSYDHRVIDGAEGARFTTKLKDDLSDIRNLLL
jgi:pyruvate dehydrogenase E2 component (dihydrolipoamide acetyltransferase)